MKENSKMKYIKPIITALISVIAIALTGCGNTADSSDASVTTAAAT